MNWQLAEAGLGAAKEVVVSLAAATGAVVALLGLNAWRRQLSGKHEYEVALNVLRAAYKVRDAIAVVRHPYMSSGEQAAALAEQEQEAHEPNASGREQDHQRALAAGYRVRWRGVMEATRDLDVARIEAEVLWGTDATKRVADLRHCVGTLNWALDEYLREKREERGSRLNEELHKEVQQTVFSMGEGSDRDPFSAEVRKSIEAIEQFVRPKLK